MRNWPLFAALLLPVVWLGASALVQERALAQSRLWHIPIEGYDPRDPLRGQYIRFSYAWAVEGDARLCRTGACTICLADRGNRVVATLAAPDTACRAPVDTAASNIEVRPSFNTGEPVQFGSRLFVSEARAPELEQQLQQGPMVMVAALTPDGRLVNRRIEPAKPPAPGRGP